MWKWAYREPQTPLFTHSHVNTVSVKPTVRSEHNTDSHICLRRYLLACHQACHQDLHVF